VVCRQPFPPPLRYVGVEELAFLLRDEEYRIGREDGRWLIEQLRSASGSAAAVSTAEKLGAALEQGAPVETTLAEKRELVDALERGAGRPRSGELRRFEVELRTIVYAETYFGDEAGGTTAGDDSPPLGAAGR
jgi:hypothetical protein